MSQRSQPGWQTRLTPGIKKFARRIIGSLVKRDADAEDAWQNTLLNIQLEYPSRELPDEKAFANWVFDTARKAGRSLHGKSKRDRLITTESGDAPEDSGPSARGSNPIPDGFIGLATKELADNIQLCLNEMKPGYRDVMLKVLEGREAEACEELGITPTMFRVRLSEARRQLAERLQNLEYEVPKQFQEPEGDEEMQGPKAEDRAERLLIYTGVWNKTAPDRTPALPDCEFTRSLFTNNPRRFIQQVAAENKIEVDMANTGTLLRHLRPWLQVDYECQGPGGNQRMICTVDPVTITNGGKSPVRPEGKNMPNEPTKKLPNLGGAYRFLLQGHATLDPATQRKYVREIRRKLSGKYAGRDLEGMVQGMIERGWLREEKISFNGVEYLVTVHFFEVQPEATYGENEATAPAAAAEARPESPADAAPAEEPTPVAGASEGAQEAERSTKTDEGPVVVDTAPSVQAPPEAPAPIVAPPSATTPEIASEPPAAQEPTPAAPAEDKPAPAPKPRRLKGGYFTQLEALVMAVFALKSPEQEHGTWDTDLAPEVSLEAIKPAAAGCSNDDLLEAVGRLVDAKIVQTMPNGSWRLAWNSLDIEIKRIERRRVIVCPTTHLDKLKRARSLAKEMANDCGLIPLRDYASRLATEWDSTDLEVLQLLLCEREASGAEGSYGVVLVNGNHDLFDAEYLLLTPTALMGCDFFKEKVEGTPKEPTERTQGPNFDEARATKRKQYRDIAELFVAGPAGTMAAESTEKSATATAAPPAAIPSPAQPEAAAAEESSARQGPRRRGPDRRPRRSSLRGEGRGASAVTPPEEPPAPTAASEQPATPHEEAATPAEAQPEPELAPIVAQPELKSPSAMEVVAAQTPETDPEIIDHVAILKRETKLHHDREALRQQALDDRAKATQLRLEADALENRAKEHDEAQKAIDDELQDIQEQYQALREAEEAEAAAERALEEARRAQAEAAARKAALLRRMKG